MNNQDNNTATFSIASNHQSFADRQKDLFAQLDVAEKTNKRKLQHADMDVDEVTVDKSKQRSVTKHFKRKESIFKRPEAPISKCLPVGRVPNFRKNPTKWTKYTLSDVSDEDMSDKGNTKAALSFLNELEKRKGSSDDNALEELPEKIVFKKSVIATKTQSEDTSDTSDKNKVSFRSSKVIMPEYVVGQKVRKEKKKRNQAEASSRQLKLDHLLDDDELDT